jgi:hypothetical protein
LCRKLQNYAALGEAPALAGRPANRYCQENAAIKQLLLRLRCIPSREPYLNYSSPLLQGGIFYFAYEQKDAGFNIPDHI